MKRLLLILLSIVLVFSLCSCTEDEIRSYSDNRQSYSATENNQDEETSQSLEKNLEETPDIVLTRTLNGSVKCDLDYTSDSLQYHEIESIQNFWEIQQEATAFSPFNSKISLVFYLSNEASNKGTVEGTVVIIDGQSKSIETVYSTMELDYQEATVSFWTIFEITEMGEVIYLGIDEKPTRDYYTIELVFNFSSPFQNLKFSHTNMKKVSASGHFYRDGEFITFIETTNPDTENLECLFTRKGLQDEYSGLTFSKNTSIKILQ
ncbi:MAG: hypothetical protein GX896_02145 [Clostridiales bacterium]|nr:hypothetical protein [Clostridiales bacterium]